MKRYVLPSAISGTVHAPPSKSLAQRQYDYQRGKHTWQCADTCGDHRIAMAASVLALRANDAMHILDAEVVNKSYPGFFEDLARVMSPP